SRHCDQYSLAIVYQEMLTGKLPFDGKNTRQLLMQHTQKEPNLQSIPASQRPIVARALHKNPNERFPCCMDFVQALMAEGTATLSPRSEYNLQLTPVPYTGDTQMATGQNTEGWRAHQVPTLPPEVLPGYCFLECLTNSPLVETWKVQLGESRPKLVHFMFGS